MIRYFSFTLLILLFQSCLKHQKADLIIHHAVIYSMDNKFTVYQAMAMKDGKIIELGKEREILNKYRYDKAIDAQGRAIFPGFIDPHSHFTWFAESLNNIDLKEVNSFTELLEVFKNNKSKTWILAQNYTVDEWSFEKINQYFPNQPIFIWKIDGHTAFVNQKAIDLISFKQSKIKDGIIKEQDAIDFYNQLPKLDVDAKAKLYQQASYKCFAHGLTTVTDAGGDIFTLNLLDSLQQHQLDIRMYFMLDATLENIEYLISKGEISKPKLQASSFKYYADGSLGSHSALLSKPYYDSNSFYGVNRINREELENYARLIYKNNFQLNTHGIGDSAIKLILDLYRDVLLQMNDLRWRIEHSQVVDEIDLIQFQELSIIPSVQPSHYFSDLKWLNQRLDESRMPFSYRLSSLLSQNGMIPLGTDFPIEDMNPIKTYHDAISREEEEALSREEALMGITFWAAMANRMEENIGSLEVGKYADFVILNKDIYLAPVSEILDAHVQETYLDGKQVFEF